MLVKPSIAWLFLLTLFYNMQSAGANGRDSNIVISGFADVFYAYDFNKPLSSARQPFLYNHNRHNEFNLNLGLLKLAATYKHYRANIALQAGTYVNDNYTTESNALKFVSEANAGIALNKKNNLWLDAGILPSHIGFESAVSFDNRTLTRSLAAENSPYFTSGAKLSYNPNQKWELAAIICNGWQRIQKVPGNSLLSAGTQVKYSNQKLTFNWSTFVGTDDPDTVRRMRYFNNFYLQVKLSEKVGLIAGFDIGAQQKNRLASKYNIWYSPVLITRYTFNKKWMAALRGEYYDDKNNVIVAPINGKNFITSGLSANIDYLPYENIICRVEGRTFMSKQAIFNKGNSEVKNNIFIVGSMAVKIN